MLIILIALGWICVVLFVLAIGRASALADATEFAELLDRDHGPAGLERRLDARTPAPAGQAPRPRGPRCAGA